MAFEFDQLFGKKKHITIQWIFRLNNLVAANKSGNILQPEWDRPNDTRSHDMIIK